MAKSTIFYSWHSDLPNNTNRGFIKNALEKIVESLEQDSSIENQLDVDEATRKEPGSPDIADSIFLKIDKCRIFICDISIINQEAVSQSKKHQESIIREQTGTIKEVRLTPNPNVLIELGYAMKSLGTERIVMIMNEAFGTVEQLPFDIRQKRVLCYDLPTESDKKSEVRKRFSRTLEHALRLILRETENKGLDEDERQLLKEIVESDGMVHRIRTQAGDHLSFPKTNKSTRQNNQNNIWMEAFHSLLDKGILRHDQGVLFKITSKGRRLVERDVVEASNADKKPAKGN